MRLVLHRRELELHKLRCFCLIRDRAIIAWRRQFSIHTGFHQEVLQSHLT
uniref:Uncharacterized protein n=1 Tax=Rhizophora mucronata TaxID=61149 RepID=A0A2P2Q2G9_RHIMU